MALFGQDIPVAGTAQLGSVLGDLVTGGHGRRAEALAPQRMKQNFDAFDALNQARISRAQANAREALTADMVQRAMSGDQAALGELGATTMSMANGQANFGSFTDGVKDVAQLELDRQIQQALARGDMASARSLSAVKTDKVLPELGAGGRAVFTPMTGDVALTALGDADLTSTNAQTEQRRASAASSYASAASTRQRTGIAQAQFDLQRSGRWNPGGSSGGGSGGSFTTPAQASIVRALGDPAAPDSYGNVGEPVVDPAVYQDFQTWRAANPQIRNGEEALLAYQQRRGGAGPVIIDPSMPGSMTRSPPALQAAPVAGARLAPDGKYYVQRNGRWFVVED